MGGDGPDAVFPVVEAVGVRGGTRTIDGVYRLRGAHRQRRWKYSCGLRLHALLWQRSEANDVLGPTRLSSCGHIPADGGRAGSVQGLRGTRAGAALRCAARQGQRGGKHLRRPCPGAPRRVSDGSGRRCGCVTAVCAVLASRGCRAVSGPGAICSPPGDGGQRADTRSQYAGDVLGVHRAGAHRAPDGSPACDATADFGRALGGGLGGRVHGLAARTGRRRGGGRCGRGCAVPPSSAAVPLWRCQQLHFRRF